MVTTTAEGQSNGKVLMYGLVFLCVVIALISISSSHAEVKHGTDALLVRECIENGNPVTKWVNHDTNRTIDCVMLDDGRFGIRVRCDGNEITCFIKNKMKRMEQVIGYLFNRGYVPK